MKESKYKYTVPCNNKTTLKFLFLNSYNATKLDQKYARLNS